MKNKADQVGYGLINYARYWNDRKERLGEALAAVYYRFLDVV